MLLQVTALSTAKISSHSRTPPKRKVPRAHLPVWSHGTQRPEPPTPTFSYTEGFLRGRKDTATLCTVGWIKLRERFGGPTVLKNVTDGYESSRKNRPVIRAQVAKDVTSRGGGIARKPDARFGKMSQRNSEIRSAIDPQNAGRRTKRCHRFPLYGLQKMSQTADGFCRVSSVLQGRWSVTKMSQNAAQLPPSFLGAITKRCHRRSPPAGSGSWHVPVPTRL